MVLRRLWPNAVDAYIGSVQYRSRRESPMSQTQIASNPFALMMDPAAVIAAVECSERLARLHSRICRPLDKQQAVKTTATETAAFDEAVEAAAAAAPEF
jgi:hypothetical protein